MNWKNGYVNWVTCAFLCSVLYICKPKTMVQKKLRYIKIDEVLKHLKKNKLELNIFRLNWIELICIALVLNWKEKV